MVSLTTVPCLQPWTVYDSDEYDNDFLSIISSSSIYTAQSNPHTVLFYKKSNGNVLAHRKIQLALNSTQQILTYWQTVNHHWVTQNVQCMWKSFQMTYKNKAQQKVSKSCRNTFTHQVTHTQIKQIFHTLGYSKSSAIYTALLQATYTQSSTLTDTVPDIHTVSHPHWAQQKVIHT